MMALDKDPLIQLAPEDDVRLDVSLMTSAGMTGVTFSESAVRGAKIASQSDSTVCMWKSQPNSACVTLNPLSISRSASARRRRPSSPRAKERLKICSFGGLSFD